jgi:hypothetical protein
LTYRSASDSAITGEARGSQLPDGRDLSTLGGEHHSRRGATLDEKASKYGQLDAPHVIAAWVMSPSASESSLPVALFGAETPLAWGIMR